MLTMTLTPNRATGRKYVRMVIYRREGNRVIPRMWEELPNGGASIRDMKWREIRESEADPEFAAAWNEHVRAQAALGRADHHP